jgi:hypothetical protein
MRGVKTKDKELRKRFVIFFVLLLLFGVLLNSVRKVYKKKENAEKALVRMEEERKELENRKIFLDNSLSRLETEEGIKFEIRKKLNVAQAGENVAIIIPDENSDSAATTTPSVWQKFKNFFSGLFE